MAGFTPRESAKILELLWEHAVRPEYTVRFKWNPGDIAFWDNRATAHLAPQDVDHLNVDRVLYRVTLTGDIPVGVDGVRSESIQGEAFSIKEHPNARKRPAPRNERVEA